LFYINLHGVLVRQFGYLTLDDALFITDKLVTILAVHVNHPPNHREQYQTFFDLTEIFSQVTLYGLLWFKDNNGIRTQNVVKTGRKKRFTTSQALFGQLDYILINIIKIIPIILWCRLSASFRWQYNNTMRCEKIIIQKYEFLWFACRNANKTFAKTFSRFEKIKSSYPN